MTNDNLSSNTTGSAPSLVIMASNLYIVLWVSNIYFFLNYPFYEWWWIPMSLFLMLIQSSGVARALAALGGPWICHPVSLKHNHNHHRHQVPCWQAWAIMLFPILFSTYPLGTFPSHTKDSRESSLFVFHLPLSLFQQIFPVGTTCSSFSLYIRWHKMTTVVFSYLL